MVCGMPSEVGSAKWKPIEPELSTRIMMLGSVHGFGHAPPQSPPVSFPFRTPSLQEGAMHTLLHTRLAQSPPILHMRPSAQGGQLPPQSTSVSSPFFTMSLHMGIRQMLAMHEPLAQSPP